MHANKARFFLLFLCLFSVFTIKTTAASKVLQSGPGGADDLPSETAAPVPQEILDPDRDVNHIVVIVSHSKNPSKITLNDYTKGEDGGWKKNWAVNGICGANGISSEKAEGDKKTPEGFFKGILAFGLKDNPGSQLPYHKIAENDFWVDDPNSIHYNRLVNTANTAKDWNSAEHMIRSAPYYNYGIALDYNLEAVPGKGSAIFIHCTKSSFDSNSAGCVRIPEEYMLRLVQSTDQNTRFFIMKSADTWYESKWMSPKS